MMNLLELAASNDLDSFKKYMERDRSSVDEVGLWYGRQKGSNQMVFQQRTPLMVAATYGSIDVLKLVVSLPDVEVNQTCGGDKITALHCAASSGSLNAVEIVKLLLASGANPNLVDADGVRPVDSVVVSPKSQDTKQSLRLMLGDLKKEYPDIKNSIYSTDEFRMFSFKVRPCSRAYSHDWTECPYVHPGENAKRRDPRKYHYSCVPCPDFRKGPCRRGDMCKYAHGVFECWLHPAQYRTRLCKDGTDCSRRVCFFAHTPQELRPLYVSPRSPSSSCIMSQIATLQSNLQPTRLRSSLNLFSDLEEESSQSFSHKSAMVQNQFHRMISPKFSPRNADQSLLQNNPFGVQSPVSAASLEGNQWSRFNNATSLGTTKSSFEVNGDEPDVSWVHSLVKESPQELKGTSLDQLMAQ